MEEVAHHSVATAAQIACHLRSGSLPNYIKGAHDLKFQVGALGSPMPITWHRVTPLFSGVCLLPHKGSQRPLCYTKAVSKLLPPPAIIAS
eukprot:6210959-Pleurochrysis_carterae.AAC.3